VTWCSSCRAVVDSQLAPSPCVCCGCCCAALCCLGCGDSSVPWYSSCSTVACSADVFVLCLLRAGAAAAGGGAVKLWWQQRLHQLLQSLRVV
jgi:hypothetical protein